MDKIVSKKHLTTKLLVLISFMGAIAFLLMLVNIPLPFAPSFMKVDISELPALIVGFSFGPLAGSLVILLKIILNTVFHGTTTQYVGELSNLIVSCAFVVPASLIYRGHKTKLVAFISLVVGVLSMTLVASLSNYFVIFPLYGKLMGLDLQAFADMVKEVNPYVKDFKSLIIYAVVPFNIVKAGLTALVSMPLYKRVKKLIIRY